MDVQDFLGLKLVKVVCTEIRFRNKNLQSIPKSINLNLNADPMILLKPTGLGSWLTSWVLVSAGCAHWQQLSQPCSKIVRA